MTLVRNPHQSPITLPWPLRGMLRPGQTINLNLSKATLTQLFGGGDQQLVELESSSLLLPYDTAYQGLASDVNPFGPQPLQSQVIFNRSTNNAGPAFLPIFVGAATNIDRVVVEPGQRLRLVSLWWSIVPQTPATVTGAQRLLLRLNGNEYWTSPVLDLPNKYVRTAFVAFPDAALLLPGAELQPLLETTALTNQNITQLLALNFEIL